MNMQIDRSPIPITIKERGLPLFFCKQHPKYELNFVCREKQCQSMGLICVRCLEEHHTNQQHNKTSFMGLDDVINICQQVASPVYLSEHTHPAYLKDVDEDNQFYKLDKLCKSTLAKLRNFKLKIDQLINILEVNIKENIIQIRKRATNSLGEVGELLTFIHQKVGYHEFESANKLIKNKSKDSQLKDITNSKLQLNQSGIYSSLSLKGESDDFKFNILLQKQEDENRQKQFANIIKKITASLSADAKFLQVKEVNEYIYNYEQGLMDYETDITSGIDNIIDQTTSFIKKFYFSNNNNNNNNIEDRVLAQSAESYSLVQISSLTANKMYTNIYLQDNQFSLNNIYQGQIPCWIQLIDMIKDMPFDKQIIATIQKGQLLQKCLKTTVETLLQNDDFLDQFTTSNIYDDQNCEMFCEDLSQFLLYQV